MKQVITSFFATLRDALLPKLLSGELRVDNLEQMAGELI